MWNPKSLGHTGYHVVGVDGELKLHDVCKCASIDVQTVLRLLGYPQKKLLHIELTLQHSCMFPVDKSLLAGKLSLEDFAATAVTVAELRNPLFTLSPYVSEPVELPQ